LPSEFLKTARVVKASSVQTKTSMDLDLYFYLWNTLQITYKLKFTPVGTVAEPWFLGSGLSSISLLLARVIIL
jgi:hypothetical protein